MCEGGPMSHGHPQRGQLVYDEHLETEEFRKVQIWKTNF